jgi:hypothetical protein
MPSFWATEDGYTRHPNFAVTDTRSKADRAKSITYRDFSLHGEPYEYWITNRPGTFKAGPFTNRGFAWSWVDIIVECHNRPTFLHTIDGGTDV